MSLTMPIQEIIHGVIINDPYQWLEDRSLPQTEAWIRDQQQRCHDYFAACPALAALERRVEEYLNVEIVDQPARVLDRYFYRKRRKGQEQGSIYVRETANGAERVLISASGSEPFTSVGIYRISPDGVYLAYEVKRGGGDRKEICIVDVNSGSVLADVIPLGYGQVSSLRQTATFTPTRKIAPPRSTRSTTADLAPPIQTK
jgi:prolyl oligopeptidase